MCDCFWLPDLLILCCPESENHCSKPHFLHWDCYSLVPVSGRVFSWQYSGGKGKRSLLSAPSLDFLLQKCCSVFKKKKKSPPTLLQHRCHIVNQCLRGAGARDAACNGLETFFLSPVQVIYRRIFEDKKKDLFQMKCLKPKSEEFVEVVQEPQTLQPQQANSRCLKT